MRLKRAPKGQLWVHYNQTGGSWRYRISDGNVVYGGGPHYSTEYDAIDVGEQSFTVHFPDLPVPVPRIFRTSFDYYYTVALEDERRRRGRS